MSDTGLIAANHAIVGCWTDIKVYDLSGAADPYGYMNANADIPTAAQKKLQGSLMRENIDQGHDALLDMYVTWGPEPS